jgi:hypothetical protein
MQLHSLFCLCYLLIWLDTLSSNFFDSRFVLYYCAILYLLCIVTLGYFGGSCFLMCGSLKKSSYTSAPLSDTDALLEGNEWLCLDCNLHVCMSK